jgi:hypothetical protein
MIQRTEYPGTGDRGSKLIYGGSTTSRNPGTESMQREERIRDFPGIDVGRQTLHRFLTQPGVFLTF